MSTRYHTLHTTEYNYAAQVQTAHHLLHLTPRNTSWQQVEASTLRIAPQPTCQSETIDAFGNSLTRIEFVAPHAKLTVASEAWLRVAPRPWCNQLNDSAPWESTRAGLAYHAGPIADPVREALTMRFESPGVRVKRELELYALPSFTAGRPLIDAARDLMHRIHTEFRYSPKATEVGTSVLEILDKKHGVCQDFAHLMIGCLRALGLAARYVSGYLRTEPPEGQPRLVGADASHAWAALFVPELGWVEFDPTNDCFADQRHLVLAWGRDFSDVSPVRGVIQGGGEHTLTVGVTVVPLDE